MTSEEQGVLARLPETLTVYRGYAEDDMEGCADGIAWTLDRRAAIWYANRNRKAESPQVISGTVRKRDVWAYLEGGDLLLPPEAVYNRRDEYAWEDKARVAWGQFITTPFDVRRILGT